MLNSNKGFVDYTNIFQSLIASSATQSLTNQSTRSFFQLTFPLSLFPSVPHTRSLEARIKEELMSQGLLDSEERPGAGGDSEDEVLAELHKRQAELKALSAHNRSRKQELLR